MPQIGKCRYIMCGTFETGRQGLDASLEAGLEAHRDLVTSTYPNGGVGSNPFITIGKSHRFRDSWSGSCVTRTLTIGAARESTHCATSKLELGTWAERLVELFDEIGESQSFCTVREKVEGIREVKFGDPVVTMIHTVKMLPSGLITLGFACIVCNGHLKMSLVLSGQKNFLKTSPGR